jgi:hypothetical protein
LHLRYAGWMPTPASLAQQVTRDYLSIPTLRIRRFAINLAGKSRQRTRQLSVLLEAMAGCHLLRIVLN